MGASQISIIKQCHLVDPGNMPSLSWLLNLIYLPRDLGGSYPGDFRKLLKICLSSQAFGYSEGSVWVGFGYFQIQIMIFVLFFYLLSFKNVFNCKLPRIIGIRAVYKLYTSIRLYFCNPDIVTLGLGLWKLCNLVDLMTLSQGRLLERKIRY